MVRYLPVMIQDRIIHLVQGSDYRPLSAVDMAGRLSIPIQNIPELEEVLSRLQESGRIIRLRDGRWDDPARHNLMVGRLDLNPRGFGFVIPAADGKDSDVFVPDRGLGGAMDGDIVVVRYSLKKKKKKKGGGAGRGPSGRITEVLHRAHDKLVGVFRTARGKKKAYVSADDPALQADVLIPDGEEKNAKDGEKVLVEITHWPEPGKGHKRVLGRVAGTLGMEDTPETDELAIIHQFGLPQQFPDAVLAEAEKIPFEAGPEETGERRDLSGKVTIAIDPWNAKDRDDALSMEVDEKTGQSTVMVHIADVSRHVPQGGPLDNEARERGLSVYLVRSFIPMIPQEATQQKLSLAAGKKKAAKTVELRFDAAGELLGFDIFRSLVVLDEEMTYRQVKDIIESEGGRSDAAEKRDAPFSAEVIELVLNLDRLAQVLRAGRRRIGSVDLDVPEYDVKVGEDGKVSAVSQIERDRSHSLVEEFMLAANVAVANLLHDRGLPAIYRVHEKPDPEDLEAFADFIKTVLDRRIDPFDRGLIQQLLLDVRDTNFSEAVNMELLRCMKRARYTTECAPHYALHFPVYCHFTSPIRRYPDLVVHQVLDGYLAGKLKGGSGKGGSWNMRLEAIAAHCCNAEENADRAEREMVNLKLLRYLQERGVSDGEIFEGVITGVREFGFFAQLQEFSIEGMVRAGKLKGDSYAFDPGRRALVGRRSGRVFRLGQQVRLKIDNIDLSRRRLDFDVAV